MPSQQFPVQIPRMQTPDIRILLSHFLRQIETAHIQTRTQKPRPLHFDPRTGALTEFKWPSKPNPDSKCELDKVKRVSPCNLESHQHTHHFFNPRCLCAFLDGSNYIEAQIAVVEVLSGDGDHNHYILNGEIVAQCAKQRCGYLLCLERFYNLNDLPVHHYELRDTPLPIQDLIYISDVEKSFRRGKGLFQVMPDVVLRGNRRGLERVRPSEAKEGDSRLWRDLMAGMPEDGFWGSFVQCMQCDKVTFRHNYATNHSCSAAPSGGQGEQARTNRRHHPCRRASPDSERSRGVRLLARTDTFIIGDQPEPSTMPSMTRRIHRALTTESEHNYNPDDVSISDLLEGMSDSVSNDGSAQEGFSNEEDLGSANHDEDGEVGHAGDSELWWLHDVPELSSDDTLPDVLTILREASGSSNIGLSRVSLDENLPEVLVEEQISSA